MSSSTNSRKTDDVPAIQKVVIVGGGTAGWMTAAGLCSVLAPLNLDITLVESEAIGTVGVGEATLPHIRFFNRKLGIDEDALMKATKATYKLGIEFNDWGKIGDSYIHPFGGFGFPINRCGFHHYISRAHKMGLPSHLDQYSVPVMAARNARFQPPHADPENVLSTFGYAYQFDAGLYANFLRRFCEDRGVTRIEGRINEVVQSKESGEIECVILENGESLNGDFFVDCSGFRGLLISQTLNVPYRNWTEHLPCDRAVVAACSAAGPELPYTRATAKSSGWQWRIPLQHRVGNGYVYCSEFISDEKAERSMLGDLEAPPNSEPKRLRFTTGQRQKSWVKNCVAIGLSGGFLEPLESTGIYLIQEAITNLIEMFPTQTSYDVDRKEYNRLMDIEFERVRDFLLLHYVATSRSDSPFWRHLTSMDLPASLKHKMDLFKSTGRVVSYETGAFKKPSWLSVYYGQNIIPKGVDPLCLHMPDSVLPEQLNSVAKTVSNAVALMSGHGAYIDQKCRAE